MSKPLINPEHQKLWKTEYHLTKQKAKDCLNIIKDGMPKYVEGGIVSGKDAGQKEDKIKEIIKEIDKL